MPYQPAVLKNSRSNRDVEAIGADVQFTSGQVDVGGMRYQWNVSMLGIFQWASTIAMLVLMVMNRHEIKEMHKQIHGDDDSAPIFAKLHENILKVRTDLEAVEAVGDDGQKMFGLKDVMLHTHNELHEEEGLLSHLDDSQQAQKVDLAAFIEHHADDVECADCRENIFGFLVGLESRYEDDGSNTCGEYYCVAHDTPKVDDGACVLDNSVCGIHECMSTTPFVDCTVFTNETSCNAQGDGSCAYTPRQTEIAAECNSLEVTDDCTGFTDEATCEAVGQCKYTPAIACPTSCDAPSAIDETTGVATCQTGCKSDGDVVYDDAECANSPMGASTSDATVAGEAGACHAKCSTYNRAGSQPCYNVSSAYGPTPDEQFKGYLQEKCSDNYDTCQLFGEDHYRKHSVCEAYQAGGASLFSAVVNVLGTDGTTTIDTNNLITGPREACKVLQFCS